MLDAQVGVVPGVGVKARLPSKTRGSVEVLLT